MPHAKVMLNLSITDHKPFYSYPFTQFMLLKVIESIHKFKLKEGIKILQQFSLKLDWSRLS